MVLILPARDCTVCASVFRSVMLALFFLLPANVLIVSASFETAFTTLLPCVTVGSVWYLVRWTAVSDNLVLLNFSLGTYAYGNVLQRCRDTTLVGNESPKTCGCPS